MHTPILNLTLATAFIACFIAPFCAPRISFLVRLPWRLSAVLYLVLIAATATISWLLLIQLL